MLTNPLKNLRSQKEIGYHLDLSCLLLTRKTGNVHHTDRPFEEIFVKWREREN